MFSFGVLIKVNPFRKSLAVNFLQNVNKIINRQCTNTSKYIFSLSDPAVIKYLEYVKSEYWDLKMKPSVTRNELNKLKKLFPVVKILEERSCVVDNLSSLLELKDTEDKDMNELVKEEKDAYNATLKQLNDKLLESLFEENISYAHSDAILEVTAGVGGQEAMLFARELTNMYVGYANYKRWACEQTQLDMTDLGGVRKAAFVISGPGAFEILKLEAGVHRVQRVPETEQSGRLHTSTVSVAVLLQPTEIEVEILDRDLRIDTKRATGAGGQHVNTTDSAVRVVHLPTGISVECQTGRDQHKNKKEAMNKLRALLYQQMSDKQEQETRTLRKSQVGSGLRNEKIRTYNFNQDRVTDHRIIGSGGTVHSLEILLLGGAPLDTLITRLQNFIHKQEVLQEVEAIKNEDKAKGTSVKA